jgi:hypothetical protein
VDPSSNPNPLLTLTLVKVRVDPSFNPNPPLTLTLVKVWVMLCGEALFIFDSPYEAMLLRKLDLELIESIEEVIYDKLEIALEGLEFKLSQVYSTS